jgi:hypothetical protein
MKPSRALCSPARCAPRAIAWCGAGSSDVCKTEQASYEATISAVRQLSDSTIALSIKGEA